MEGYGPATYGDRIADTYDELYEETLDTDCAVEALAALAGGGPVLELAIGTGRLALPLAERGLEVHGVDVSERMVAKLREKPGGEAIPVTMGDFADVPVEGAYRLVFVAFNTLFGLLTQEDQLRCFANVAKHLTDDGAFVVAAFFPHRARFDRAATLDKLAALTAEAKGAGAQLVVFPETFVPAYPSSAWAKFLAGWADPRAKGAFAQLSRESLEVPGPDADRLGEIARENEVWLVTGVSERDPERPGTLYNPLLYHRPDRRLALHHRKLVPPNHERLLWGQGDGQGLPAIETGIRRGR